jgi:hypothetical protein
LAGIKVLAGDLEKGGWLFVSMPGQALMMKGKSKIDLKEEARGVEFLDEEKVSKLGRKAGWAFLGGVTLGPLGLIGGALLGGRKKKATFACELKDGRKFMGETDEKSWKKLQKTVMAATFMQEESEKQGEPEEPEKQEKQEKKVLHVRTERKSLG